MTADPHTPTVRGKYFGPFRPEELGNTGILLLEWTDDLSYFKLTTTPNGCELGPEARKQLVLQLLALVLPSES